MKEYIIKDNKQELRDFTKQKISMFATQDSCYDNSDGVTEEALEASTKYSNREIDKREIELKEFKQNLEFLSLYNDYLKGWTNGNWGVRIKNVPPKWKRDINVDPKTLRTIYMRYYLHQY